MMNAQTVVTPTRTIVQGSALPIVCATVSLGNEYEVPKLNRDEILQVVPVLREDVRVR